MDQDVTWQGGRPRPRLGYIVLDGDPDPPKKGAQHPLQKNLAHVYLHGDYLYRLRRF